PNSMGDFWRQGGDAGSLGVRVRCRKQVNDNFECAPTVVVLKVFAYRPLHFADRYSHALLTELQSEVSVLGWFELTRTALIQALAAVNASTVLHITLICRTLSTLPMTSATIRTAIYRWHQPRITCQLTRVR